MDIANEKKTPLMITGQSCLKFRATLDWDPHQSLDKIKPHPDEAPRQQISFLSADQACVCAGRRQEFFVGKEQLVGDNWDPYLLRTYFFHFMINHRKIINLL